MSRFNLTKEALKRFLGRKADFIRDEHYKSWPRPKIDGTLIFDTVKFIPATESAYARIELAYKNTTLTEMPVKNAAAGDTVILVLTEGIMKIEIE